MTLPHPLLFVKLRHGQHLHPHRTHGEQRYRSVHRQVRELRRVRRLRRRSKLRGTAAGAAVRVPHNRRVESRGYHSNKQPPDEATKNDLIVKYMDDAAYDTDGELPHPRPRGRCGHRARGRDCREPAGSGERRLLFDAPGILDSATPEDAHFRIFMK